MDGFLLSLSIVENTGHLCYPLIQNLWICSSVDPEWSDVDLPEPMAAVLTNQEWDVITIFRPDTIWRTLWS